jgi:hypothetical protein
MNELHHDWAIAVMYAVLELLPPETFGNVTKASLAFDLYQRLKDGIEAYDVQVGKRGVEPSVN